MGGEVPQALCGCWGEAGGRVWDREQLLGKVIIISRPRQDQGPRSEDKGGLWVSRHRVTS